MTTPTPSSVSLLHHPLEQAKQFVSQLVVSCIPTAYPEVSAESAQELYSEIISKLSKPTGGSKGVAARGELALPCFVFTKKIKGAPPQVAVTLATAISKYITHNKNDAVTSAEAAGPYINFTLSLSFLTGVLQNILNGSYLAKLPANKPRVMIEYSQPNTHKAFHVGHMRNAALGDSLVRLYEQVGHPVVAVNYFGDEGAHVAKCLWFLKRYMQQHPEFELESVPANIRGEWLGKMYSSAVEALDLSTLTKYPYPYVIAAKVLTVEKHPDATAPANWNKVTLQIDAAGTTAVVICGGKGYNVGDLVAYMPVGAKVKKNVAVEPKDMKGVMSHGIIMAEKELGIEEEKKEEKKEEAAGGKGKGGKGDKAAAKDKKDDKKADNTTPNNKIFVLPADLPIGVELTEAGRLPNIDVAADVKVLDEINNRKQQVRDTLTAMEAGEPNWKSLWDKTKEWSLTEFKSIYSWLDCRFDHDFFESECSEPSKEIVEKYRDSVFINSNGALGADLSQFGLGFCMVLKSDGSGLYATKDLALAARKFDKFNIDISLYIVDAAQTLHFKQVFKTLELMGYEKAKQCIHLPYGQVVLPSGKMSSRTGTVVYFSQLTQLLDRDISEKFLKKYETGEESVKQPDGTTTVRKVEQWSADEVAVAKQAISVATIKYGMLNHDTAKDIVFVLDEWTAKSGNTGPYMLYAYARIQSILREVAAPEDGKVDFTLCTHESERAIILQLFEFWDVAERAVANNNPSAVCGYLFDLAKGFMSFYEHVPIRPLTGDSKTTRLAFIRAVGDTLKTGLNLLGIATLERM